VFASAEGEVWHRRNLDWSAAPFELWREPHEHLLAVDGARSFVAVDEGRVVGFSAALLRGEAWFLSALFIAPDYQGVGVGRELLARSWSDSARRRITITDSIQPVSNGLYASRGLIPTTPVLFLAGEPQADGVPELVSSPAGPDALAAIDRVAYGFDRSVDHRYWFEHSESVRSWTRDGEPLGYAYVAKSGLIGPVAGIDGASAAAVLQAELSRRERKQTIVLIPGSARKLVATALAAGLRFARAPGLLLTSDGCPPPEALAISGYWLF